MFFTSNGGSLSSISASSSTIILSRSGSSCTDDMSNDIGGIGGIIDGGVGTGHGTIDHDTIVVPIGIGVGDPVVTSMDTGIIGNSSDDDYDADSIKKDAASFYGLAGSGIGVDEDDEYDEDPLSTTVPDNARTNYVQTLMNYLNGVVGSGVLSMPMAFRDGGLVVASIVTPLIGLMSCYCIHLLLAINRRVMAQTGRKEDAPYDYHELAEHAVALGPRPLRRFAKFARLLVIGTIICTQIGACCVYYVFIATNLNKFILNQFGDVLAPSQAWCMFGILPLVIGINWIRNIRHLSFISTVANVLQIAGITVVLYNLLSQPIQDPARLAPVGKKIPQFFASTLFIFEGSSVSMSLYRAIRKPRQFQQPLGVLNVGIISIMIFYTGIGFLGYLQYGDTVGDTITVSFPPTLLYDIIELSYALVVLGTYPVLLYVPIQVLWGIIRRKLRSINFGVPKTIIPAVINNNNNNNVDPKLLEATGAGMPAKKSPTFNPNSYKMLAIELTFRTALVILTYLLAVVVPKLDLIISLVGSITSSSIAVIIPTILHTITFWHQRKGWRAKVQLLSINLTLFSIGIGAFFVGFYYSLRDIIDSYSEGDKDGTMTQSPTSTSMPTLSNSTTITTIAANITTTIASAL